jgi:tetratricopeptide (TPR) repeat protein
MPADQSGYQLLIAQLEQQGHYAEARPWREQLHRLNACAPENPWRLGRTLFWQGYPEQAEALLKQQLRCSAAAPAYLLLGQLAARRQDWEQASRFYQQGLEQIPDQPELLSAQALSLERQGQTEQARALLKRLKSPGPDGLRLRARLSLQAGEPQAALRDLQQLRQLGAHPDDQQELLLLYVQMGRAREAEAELQALLARAPERRVALEPLAALIRQLPRRGRPDAPQASAERRWRR